MNIANDMADDNDGIIIPSSKPIPELPQNATLEEITARALELRNAELSSVWCLTESRFALGQALSLAHDKLTAKEFATWLDEVRIPTDMWRAYVAFWAKRDNVRTLLSERINGQQLLPGIVPQAPAVDVATDDVVAVAADKGAVGGVDFSEMPTLMGELRLREKNIIAQCRESRRFMELLAAKVVAGEEPTAEESIRVRAIRASLTT